MSKAVKINPEDIRCEALKPCIYCGDDGRLVYHVGKDIACVQCIKCGMRGPASRTIKTAALKWNGLQAPKGETGLSIMRHCPECGNFPTIQNIPSGYIIECPQCRSQCVRGTSLPDLINVWNRKGQ